MEFLENRLYFTSLDEPPPAASKSSKKVYYSTDDLLIYNNFYHDFGPLNIAHMYRFAVGLHDILADEKNTGKAVVVYTKSDARSRANAGCMLAVYMVLIQSWPPHLALAPLAEADPPVMPFRDAGYSQADYCLSIQDVVYGCWKAKDKGLINLTDFNCEEYETYERVENGDFNWVSPHFIAFASPSLDSKGTKKEIDSMAYHRNEKAFMSVLDYFEDHDIGLVVRLNKPLYDRKRFEERKMKHMEMFFEDGTCPELADVRKFIAHAKEQIDRRKVVAVHCKAGLGRTGCLIGAYLIHTYAFTANEVIGFMRFLRPGMVVGPQQHWLHIYQHTFREWYFTTSKPILTPTRSPLASLQMNDLPCPTPGQPRKVSAKRRLFEDATETTETIIQTTTSPTTRRVVSYSATTTSSPPRRGSPRRVSDKTAINGARSPSGKIRRI